MRVCEGRMAALTCSDERLYALCAISQPTKVRRRSASAVRFAYASNQCCLASA